MSPLAPSSRNWTALLLLAVCACAGSNGVQPPPAKSEGEAEPGNGGAFPPRKTMRVGNQAAGVEDQPDYDRAALEIREQVQGVLPSPLPPPKMACVAMYDAAVAAYRKREGSGSQAASILESTKADGIEACQAETSPAAASCVAVLATRRRGEFPWLLDQCSRAFPVE